MAIPSVSDRDFTEKLIEEVKRHPVLYNSREPGYKDRFRVEAEWQIVAVHMGCSADSAKKRWQNLRGSYSRSRCSQNQPNGSGVPGKKKPQFYLAQQMCFLEPHMQHGPTLCSLSSSKPEPLWEEIALVDITTPSTSSPSLSPADEPETESLAPATLAPPVTPVLITPVPATPVPVTPAPVTPALVTPVSVTAAPVKQRKRAAPTTQDKDDTVKDDIFKEMAARFLDAKMRDQDSTNNYKEELDSLRGLLPHMATLSSRKKRIYLRKIYNLLFEMVEEEENEATTPTMSATDI